jgi:hypothetical protein
LLFNVRSFSNQSFADTGNSNITRLPLLMPMACQGVFGKEKENREEKKEGNGKEFLVYRVGLNNLLISLVFV